MHFFAKKFGSLKKKAVLLHPLSKNEGKIASLAQSVRASDC